MAVCKTCGVMFTKTGVYSRLCETCKMKSNETRREHQVKTLSLKKKLTVYPLIILLTVGLFYGQNFISKWFVVASMIISFIVLTYMAIRLIDLPPGLFKMFICIGMALAIFGFTFNITVVLINGLQMPVILDKMEADSLLPGLIHDINPENPKLPHLGDWIETPIGILSPGDILLLGGITIILTTILTTKAHRKITSHSPDNKMGRGPGHS